MEVSAATAEEQRVRSSKECVSLTGSQLESQMDTFSCVICSQRSRESKGGAVGLQPTKKNYFNTKHALTNGNQL